MWQWPGRKQGYLKAEGGVGVCVLLPLGWPTPVHIRPPSTAACLQASNSIWAVVTCNNKY